MSRRLPPTWSGGFAALEASLVTVILITVILSFVGVAHVLFLQRTISKLVSENSGAVSFASSRSTLLTTQALEEVLVAKLREIGWSNPEDYKIHVSRFVLPVSETCADFRHTSLVESGGYMANAYVPIETIFKNTKCSSFARSGSIPSANESLEGATLSGNSRQVLGIQLDVSLKNTMPGAIFRWLVEIPGLNAVEFSYLRGE